jgi:hypothetical protein
LLNAGVDLEDLRAADASLNDASMPIPAEGSTELARCVEGKLRLCFAGIEDRDAAARRSNIGDVLDDCRVA